MDSIKINSLKLMIVLIGISFCYCNSLAQFNIDNWKIYSSMQDVRTAAVDSRHRIWAGTTGGLFVYDSTAEQPFHEFRNTEGLLSMVFTAMCADTNNKLVYMGTNDGYIEIADENFRISHITDIVSAGFTNPMINDIYLYDTLAYIGGGFGLAVFDTKRKVFVETITKFGSFQQKTPVNQILIKDNKIWLATEAGIASADLNTQIIDPQVWKNYGSSNGLVSQQPVVSICFHNGSLYAAAGKKLYEMVNDSFIVKFPIADYDDFRKLSSNDNKLYFSTKYDVFILENGSLNMYRENQIINGHIFSGNTLIIYYQGNGIKLFENNNLKEIKPNTPASNLFLSMDLDEKGNLWSATDYEGRGRGFMKFSNGKWTNFTNDVYPQMLNNDYYLIASDKNGKIFASNWGRGMCIVEDNDTGYVFTIVNNKNSPMKGVADDTNWVIAGECIADNEGVVWFSNWGRISNGPSFLAYKKDGTFSDFLNCSSPNKRGFITVAIDLSGTKWFGSSPFEPHGLLYFNDRNTIDDKSDDKCGVITVSTPTSSATSKLIENAQTALAVDRFGSLWIGYESGLSVLFNPSVIFNNSPVFSIRKVNMLNSQRVNDIFVDAINNKWIATNNGIWVLNSDGTETITTINKSNSPLVDNAVYSIVIDGETGLAYFGTKKGLCTARTLSVKPLQDYNINCYPQPYNPAKDGYLTIDGLAPDSEIKILTIDGGLVKSLSVTGRKTIWDGTDNSGNYVSSGIYMIIASSATTDGASVGKIAVISNK
ncbi:MAG: hypothetical protein EPN82_12530 [Bacteroidetes bacterium]|nr:MAG: hypothetical protein EPN82_12530 [Bacteroidota bacterium]